MGEEADSKDHTEADAQPVGRRETQSAPGGEGAAQVWRGRAFPAGRRASAKALWWWQVWRVPGTEEVGVAGAEWTRER